MPLQRLLNRAIISGSGVSVADRDRKKLVELFARGWAGARDDGWSCERLLRNNGKFGVALYLSTVRHEESELSTKLNTLALLLVPFSRYPNKPRKKKGAGSVELPEAAKQAEIAQWDSRLETAKTRWMQASLEQKTKWLDQMDSIGKSFAPANETEPRRAFLMCLVALLEPELPLSEVA